MSENTPGLAKSRRCGIGTVTAWTILLMVLLRVSIGWHFLYEGIWKLRDGGFSATPYLLASVGPFKDFFKSMVDDADGFRRMGVVRDDKGRITAIKPDYQKAEIARRAELITKFYELSAEQQKSLDSLVKKKTAELDALYGLVPITRTTSADPNGGAPGVKVESTDEDLFSQIAAYDLLLQQVAAEEKSHDVEYLKERMEFNNSKVSSARNAILVRVEKPAKDVAPIAANEIDRRGKMTPEELKWVRENEGGLELTEAQLAKGPPPMPQAQHFPGNLLVELGMQYKAPTRTEWQDLGMMFGLCAIGGCLMLGLFTRLAAFGAVTFLAMFYFSMPPWPGVPEVAGMAEGHYHIVNKNLIELIACLMLMTTRVGRWFGLDAFIAAIRDRRRRKRADAVLAVQSVPQERLYIPALERETARKA